MTLCLFPKHLSLRMRLYGDTAKQPKKKKKGSASIWYIYASLPL